jgi:glycoside hydrolase-like protein/putative peptidoglycan binding protein
MMRMLHVRRLVAALAVAATVLAGLAFHESASAATRVMPRSFTGYAFDACQAPAQDAMDVWRDQSPYWGVGIYTSGVNRYCDVQVNLSADWVAQQDQKGWRLFPIHVGLQASCSHPEKTWERIDPNPADGYAAARAQGVAQADEAVAAAQSYGIGRQSTLWYDLEAFDISNTDCRESALSLVSAWTDRLHELGYDSGYYSSAASGIKMLDDARQNPASTYSLPDRIWIAHYVHRDECELRWGTTTTEYISDDGWQQKRMRQFCGTHTESYGGVSISIDSNYMDFGRGSVPPRQAGHCNVTVDFPRYPGLSRGDRGDKVKAAQCFLRQKGFYGGRIHGRYHRGTAKAVKRFQRSESTLGVTGALNHKTWTVLLARGSDPLLKYGSRSNAVRRLQRALNARDGARLDVTGVFERSTQGAVKDYQQGRGLTRTGVVTAEVWDLLQQGRR